jgi:hypothetical protein
MNKHLIVSGIAVLLICLGLSGCTETNEEDKFIGTWQMVDISVEYMKPLLVSQDHMYEFLENGTIKISVIHYNDPDNKSDTYISINWNNWNISEGKLHMGNETILIPYDYQFSSNNNELRLSNSQIGWYEYIRIQS